MLYKTNNECFSFVRWYRWFHGFNKVLEKLQGKGIHLKYVEKECINYTDIMGRSISPRGYNAIKSLRAQWINWYIEMYHMF